MAGQSPHHYTKTLLQDKSIDTAAFWIKEFDKGFGNSLEKKK